MTNTHNGQAGDAQQPAKEFKKGDFAKVLTGKYEGGVYEVLDCRMCRCEQKVRIKSPAYELGASRNAGWMWARNLFKVDQPNATINQVYEI